MTNALFFKAQLKPQLLNKTFPKHFNCIIFPSDNLRVSVGVIQFIIYMY